MNLGQFNRYNTIDKSNGESIATCIMVRTFASLFFKIAINLNSQKTFNYQKVEIRKGIYIKSVILFKAI